MTKMKLGAMALLWGSMAVAQTPPPGVQKARWACAEDRKKLCPDVEPGGGRIVQCLQTHLDAVSEGCKAAMSEAHGKRHGGGAPPASEPGH